MVATVAALCIAMSPPLQRYAGEPPRLRVPQPQIAMVAASAAGFAPPGWQVERAILGDLNRDKRPDLVVVLKGADPNCVMPTDAADGSINTNPRLVLVAFASKAGFALQSTSARIIPRIDDPYLDDPLNLDALAIRNGVLQLGLTFFRSMGGWTTYSSKFSFRWDGRRLALIGFDREAVRRNSGETETLSVNFVTGRAKQLTGSIGDDGNGGNGAARWRRLAAGQRASLETIGNGLAYQPKLAAP